MAVGILACLAIEKGVEVATKEWSQRPRPVYVQPTALRDDAPVEGASMPSGHAAIAACGAVLLVPLVPAPVAATAVVGTALSAYTRLHQGAHEPADIAARFALGVGLGLAMHEVADHLAAL